MSLSWSPSLIPPIYDVNIPTVCFEIQASIADLFLTSLCSTCETSDFYFPCNVHPERVNVTTVIHSTQARKTAFWMTYSCSPSLHPHNLQVL